jgi:arsenite/tail-anchored protein-transporting ATPase
MAAVPPPDLRDLLARRFILVGGKGGVGKTTIAAALGAVAAERGQRCLLVSTDPAHSLGDAFGRSIGDRETALGVNLWGLEIDPDAEAIHHLDTVKQQMKRFVHQRMWGEIDRQLDLARYSPGAAEAALLERVARLMDDASGESRFDLTIFDTAPTGHTLRLLTLPEVMAAWTDGLLRHRERSGRFASTLRHLGGGRATGDEFGVIDSPKDLVAGSPEERINELLTARRRLFRGARERLLDSKASAFLLVLNPDKLSILESLKAIDVLTHFSVPIAGIVVNRVLPENVMGEFIEARRAQEAEYRREIDRLFAAYCRIVIPLLPYDVNGLDALQKLGRLLPV